MSFGRALCLVTVVSGALSCGRSAEPEGALATARQALAVVPPVRISEIHYDNAGADVGEAIELSGPAGTDLTGWRVVLYNGNGGAAYNTRTLSGAIPATCGAQGVVVLSYPSNGIQNGGATVTGTSDPDGVALVDASGAVVEFLSYEGAFSAVGGPAAGLASADLGARELGSEPAGQSLQRGASGLFAGPAQGTFGNCNDAGEPPPAPAIASLTIAPSSATVNAGATQSFSAVALDAAGQPVAGAVLLWTSNPSTVATVDGAGLATALAAGDATIVVSAANGVTAQAILHVQVVVPPPVAGPVRVSELHYDNLGSDLGEAIEIEGPAGSDLTGWTVVLYDGNGGGVYNTQTLSGSIPATCDGRGVVTVNYPVNGIQNGGPDGLALVDGSGQVVEFLSYEGIFTATAGPAAGLPSIDIGASESSSAPVGQSLQRNDGNSWQAATASFGACNGTPAPPPPVANRITFSGRTLGDPALPVGFQDQLFATVRNSANVVVPAVITWTSETPAVASIDGSGVMTALAEGTATLRATADDDVTTATLSLPTRVAVASITARYAGNAAFGEPTDADPSDDFILRHPEYTTSYNVTRGTPNWVSYDLEATHFGGEDRCDCFTFDPALPAAFPRYTTADYTGAGEFHGFGIDRGHLARSFDRTSSSLDNAFTFYFTNIAPQAADLNQGPWAILENDLGDLARLQNKEVYIIAGVSGHRGTLKNQGAIVIPARFWKVAVILPRDRGPAEIVDYRDLEVIAVDMPNEPGVRNVPWQTYRTTVQALEALSGYDLLAALPDKIEQIVQRDLKPPLAALAGPTTSTEGAAVTFTGAGSLDPNGTIVSHAWSFGDGATATGPVVSHSFGQDGAYTVVLTVTDNDGLTDVATTTVTVANVPPAIGALSDLALTAGDTAALTGSFIDPGADVWTATIDWGDGSGAVSLPLTGTAFTASHLYPTAGAFAATVRISDDHATATRTAIITVAPRPTAVADALALVAQLAAAHKLGAATAALLTAELRAAQAALDRGNTITALIWLRAVSLEVNLLTALRLLPPADARPLQTALSDLIQSLAR